MTANSTAITTKAATTALTVAEASIVTPTGEIGALQNSVNGLGNSFYTKALTEELLSGKEAAIADGALTIARTNGLQAAIDTNQGTIQTVQFTNALTTFTTPVACQFDLGGADLTANNIYDWASFHINSAITATFTARGVSTPRIFQHPTLGSSASFFALRQTSSGITM